MLYIKSVSNPDLGGDQFIRKIIVLEHVSLDGFIQAPGGPDEDITR